MDAKVSEATFSMRSGGVLEGIIVPPLSLQVAELEIHAPTRFMASKTDDMRMPLDIVRLEDLVGALNLTEVDALTALLAARRLALGAPPPPLPVCAWERPIVDGQCIDPCPACLGYPQGNPAFPTSQQFYPWAVFSRNVISWPAEDVATNFTDGFDEIPAAGYGDTVVVQATGKLYLSSDAGKKWREVCATVPELGSSPSGSPTTVPNFPKHGWGNDGVGILPDGTILVAAPAGDCSGMSPYWNGTGKNCTLAVHRVKRATGGECSWEAPALLRPFHEGGLLLAGQGPCDFRYDPFDGTVYYAHSEVCHRP
jgi:hypothetical protein